MTAQALAEHFEVSKRTILRDIDTLAAAKIPVYTTQGRGGGIAILDGFVLNKATLTEDEQAQILFALQSLSATRHADSSGVLSKLGALFQKADADWIEVDFSRWGQGTKDNMRFDLLKRAIISKTAIQFEYVSAYGESSERKAYPLKLVFKSKAWYLQAFCIDKQGYRTFKLNRMLGVRMTDESFADRQLAPPPIEAPQTAPCTLVPLELEFKAHAAYRVYDEFDEDCISQNDDGSLHVFVRLPEDNWLYGFLMSFGNDVKVCQPQSVKDKLKKKAGIT